MSDLYWQDNIREGSDNLLAAIKAARAGTCPATPVEPVGLPKDLRERKETIPARRRFSLKGVPLLPFDRVKHLLDAGATPREIADITRMSRERVDYWIERVQNGD